MGPKSSRRRRYFVSFTTPTISYRISGLFGVVSTQNRWPIASDPFRNFRANVSFTIATFSDVSASRSSN